MVEAEVEQVRSQQPFPVQNHPVQPNHSTKEGFNINFQRPEYQYECEWKKMHCNKVRYNNSWMTDLRRYTSNWKENPIQQHHRPKPGGCHWTKLKVLSCQQGLQVRADKNMAPHSVILCVLCMITQNALHVNCWWSWPWKIGCYGIKRPRSQLESALCPAWPCLNTYLKYKAGFNRQKNSFTVVFPKVL